MKKSVLIFTLMASLSLLFSACSSDNDNEPSKSYDETLIYEMICKGNAIISSDDSIPEIKSDNTKLRSLVSEGLTKSDEEAEAVADISSRLNSAWRKLGLKDERFDAITGSSGSRAYKGLFNPTTLKSECDSIWVKYVKLALEKTGKNTDDTTVQATVSYLKSSISKDEYGEKAVTDKQQGFNCEFHPEDSVLTFSNFDEVRTLGVKGDGDEKSFTYKYIGTYNMGDTDDWVAYNPEYKSIVETYGGIYFPCSVFKSNESNAGEYTYLFLTDDNPEDSYHIEFRYGSDLPALTKSLTGKYALWQAAGIPADADAELIDNVIKLFTFENLGVSE